MQRVIAAQPGRGLRHEAIAGEAQWRATRHRGRPSLEPGPADGNLTAAPSRDAAFAPTPVNDAILAEVNSQRLATTEIMMQARTLSTALAQFQTALSQTKTNLQETARLRVSVNEMKQRLDSLETAPAQLPATPISTTNEAPDSLSP